MGKIGGKTWFAKTLLKIVKTVFFGRFRYLCKQKEKSLGSGPFPRDGLVTGNKYLFCLGLMYSSEETET